MRLKNTFSIARACMFLLSFFVISLGLAQETRTFNTPGAFTFTVPTYSGPALGPGESLLLDIEVIIVGAGGGGGRGEVRIITLTANEGDSFTGIIGIGGAGATAAGSGGNGAQTTFNGITSNGGFGGGGGNAGSGGNSGAGFNGGTGVNTGGRRAGGGGGGANGVGVNGFQASPPPRTTGGNGGVGIQGFGGGGGGTRNGGAGGQSSDGFGTDGGGNGASGLTGGITVGGDGTNGGGGGGGTTGGGNGGNGVVQITITFSILPVEYLYFDASFTRQERLVELKWATGKEWENSHFEVERAVNDVKNWETIGRVEGQGYSDGPVDYQFKDKDVPLVGGNAFYRLRQVDFNGQYAYSEVVSARIPALEITNGVWRAFPNPTDGNHFRISLMDKSQYHEEEIVFRLVHPMVYTAPQQVASEWEMNAAIQETVRKMPKGVFVVEIQWGRKVEHIKVIKK